MERLKDFFRKRKKHDIYYYYPAFVAAAVSLSLLYSTIDTFQQFFPPLSQIFISMFTFTVTQSSDSHLVIIENVLKTTFGAFIGCFGAYVIYQMADHIVWITICLHFIFLFITCSLTMSTSKWLPFANSKLLFLSLFVILYANEILQKNTNVFLKYFVCALAMLLTVVVTCLLFNPYFSSTLFMKYSCKMFARSRLLFGLAGQELLNRSNCIIEKDTTGDTEFRNSVVNRIRNQATMTRYTVNDPFFPLETVTETAHLNNSQATTIENNSRLNSPIDVGSDSGKTPKIRTSNTQFSDKVISIAAKYSKGLNTLYKYLGEAKKEEWSKSIISKLEEMAFQLDRNHKKLIMLHSHVLGKVSDYRIKMILSLTPYIDILIQESNTILMIMEKMMRIRSHYFFFFYKKRSDLSSIYKQWTQEDVNSLLISDEIVSMDTLQFLAMQSFETISATTTEFRQKYQDIVANQEYYCTSDDVASSQQRIDPEISRIHWFLMGIIKFSADLKKLSFVVYDISIHPVESNHMMLVIRSVYHSFLRTIHGLANHIKSSLNRDYPFPSIVSKLNYPLAQRIKVVFMAAIMKILCEWKFALKFTLGATLLSLIYYELKKHSTFVLFRNFEWVIITYQFVMSPTVGTSSLVAAQRLIGTVIGALLSYGVAVLITLPNNVVAQGVLFHGITFVTFFNLSSRIKHNEFPQAFSFIGNTYLTLTISMFYTGSPDYLICLLRALHISIGNLAVLLVSSLVFPMYDQNRLDRGLCKLMSDSNKMFQQLLSYYLHLDHTCLDTKNKDKNSQKLKEMRSEIASMGSLINNVTLELIFHRKLIRQYRDLLKIASKLYVYLVSLDSTCQLLPSSIILKFKESPGPLNFRLLFSELDWTANYLGQLANDKTIRVHSADSALYYDSLIRHNMYQNKLLLDDNNEFDQNSISMSAAMLAASSFTKTLEVSRHILWSMKGVQELKRQSVHINVGSASK